MPPILTTGAGVYRAIGGGAIVATTWNPSDKSSSMDLSGGNLIATNNSGSMEGVRSVDAISGKIYFEIVWSTYLSPDGNGNMQIGVANASATLTTTLLGQASNAAGYRDDSLLLYNFGTNAMLSAQTSGSGDNVGVAIDRTNNKMWIRVNGGSWDGGSDDPSLNTGGLSISPVTGTIYAVTNSNSFSFACTAKFDSASWTYSAPSGFGILGH